MPLQMTDDQKQRVLQALSELTPKATVKQISERAGFEVTLPGLKPLVQAGLLVQVEVTEPPINRFSITEKGRAWLKARLAGSKEPAPAVVRPADEAIRALTDVSGNRAELIRRFEAGEGETPESKRALAKELGYRPQEVGVYHKRWLAGNNNKSVDPPALDQTSGPAQEPAPTGGLPAAGQIPSPGPVPIESTAGTPPIDPSAPSEPVPSAAAAGSPETPPPVPETNAERMARLHARFAAGEGTTAESKDRLAKEFGIKPWTVATYLTDWRKAQKKEQPGAPQAPAAGRMNPATKAVLYARFAAGEHETESGCQKLADDYHIQQCTIAYHLMMWKKAGCPGKALAITPAPAPVVEPAEPGEALTDGDALVFSDDNHGREFGQTGGHGEPAAVTVRSAVITPGATEEMVVRVEGTAADAPVGQDVQVELVAAHVDPGTAPSTPMAASSTTGQGSSAQTAPATTKQPLTSFAEAMIKAGLVKPDQVVPAAPTRRMTCHVCRKSCDPLFWYDDPKSGRGGHKECVTAPVAAGPADEVEQLPKPGEICEGVVFSVDMQSGMYALVDLTAYSKPELKLWMRGKVTRAQVVRSGWCDDVRDWLKLGDLVNVKVLEATPGKGGQRPRLNLSIKQAPAHAHERIPLEATGPVTVMGMQLSPEIVKGYQTDEIGEARHLALDLIRTHRLDETRLVNLVERILTNGIAQTTEEVEAEVAATKRPAPTGQSGTSVQPFGSMLERVHQLALEKEELLKQIAQLAGAPERIRQLEEQLAEAERSKKATAGANRLLEAELVEAKEKAGQAEANANMAVEVNESLRRDLNRAQAEALTAEMQALASERELKRHALGLCAACLHGIDGMCPYTDAVEPTFELPDENKHERHHGKHIVFGPRRVVSCDLLRPEATELSTAAD